MSKTDYSLSKQKREDLMAAFREATKQVLSSKTYEIAVKMPAPRYYITPKQAYQIIAPMMKGDFTAFSMLKPLKRALYRSIFDKTIEMSARREFAGKSLWYVMPFVVCSPAPQFFISPKTLMMIRGELKHKRYDEDGRHIEPSRMIRVRTKKKKR
jgi:hypothetical protein